MAAEVAEAVEAGNRFKKPFYYRGVEKLSTFFIQSTCNNKT